METDSTTFERLALIEPIMRAVRDEGYSHPTPVQSAAIPEILAGRDVMTTAKTGTGKTAAFAMPILQLLHESGPSEGFLRCLILTPTRELAFAGHPSVGAAWAAVTCGLAQPRDGALLQQCAAGLLAAGNHMPIGQAESVVVQGAFNTAFINMRRLEAV